MRVSKFYNILPFVVVFALAILAYYFYPVDGNYDLSKYYHLMDMIKINDIESITYIKNYFELLFRIYMYMIVLIGNYRLFQFFPVLLFYSILFYIIFDYGKSKEYSKFSIVFVSLACITLFRFVLSGSVFACLLFSLATLGIYSPSFLYVFCLNIRSIALFSLFKLILLF